MSAASKSPTTSPCSSATTIRCCAPRATASSSSADAAPVPLGAVGDDLVADPGVAEADAVTGRHPVQAVVGVGLPGRRHQPVERVEVERLGEAGTGPRRQRAARGVGVLVVGVGDEPVAGVVRGGFRTGPDAVARVVPGVADGAGRAGPGDQPPGEVVAVRVVAGARQSGGGLAQEPVVVVIAVRDRADRLPRRVAHRVRGDPAQVVVAEGADAPGAVVHRAQLPGDVVAELLGGRGDAVLGRREPGVAIRVGGGSRGVDASGQVAVTVVVEGGGAGRSGGAEQLPAVVVGVGVGAVRRVDRAEPTGRVVVENALRRAGARPGLPGDPAGGVVRLLADHPTGSGQLLRASDDVVRDGPGAVGGVGVSRGGRLDDRLGEPPRVEPVDGPVPPPVGVPGAVARGVIAEAGRDRRGRGDRLGLADQPVRRVVLIGGGNPRRVGGGRQVAPGVVAVALAAQHGAVGLQVGLADDLAEQVVGGLLGAPQRVADPHLPARVVVAEQGRHAAGVGGPGHLAQRVVRVDRGGAGG